MEKPAPLFVVDPPALSKTAECLNSAFAADPNAIHALIVNRVPCNQALVDHPQIYVDMLTVVDSSLAQATLLGVLNGVLVANGLPRVATKWSTEPDEEGRRKLLGFCDYQDDVKEQSPSSPSDSFIDEVVSVIDELRGWTPPFNVDERLELVAAWDRASKLQIKLAAMKAARIAGENNSGNLPSVEDLWEIYSHLQLLRSEEASQVTFTAPNPDDNDLPNEVVGVKDLWTEWLEVDFRGATLLECLRKAVDARRAWYVEKEAKKIKLPWKT